METILSNLLVLSSINSLVNSSCIKDSDLYKLPVQKILPLFVRITVWKGPPWMSIMFSLLYKIESDL